MRRGRIEYRGIDMVLGPVLAVGPFMKIMVGLFILCSIALILMILIQKGKGGGLSSAFGGGMAGGILGTKTGDFLTWVTIGLAALFLFLAGVLVKFYRPSVGQVSGETTPVATAPAEGTGPIEETAPVSTAPVEGTSPLSSAPQEQAEPIDTNAMGQGVIDE